jgi:hypothetical protein
MAVVKKVEKKHQKKLQLKIGKEYSIDLEYTLESLKNNSSEETQIFILKLMPERFPFVNLSF